MAPMRTVLVPHTGIAANVRRVPAEYGCYGRLWPVPVDSDRLEGTNKGTKGATRQSGQAASARLRSFGICHVIPAIGSLSNASSLA
jgi:hypothetical protein